VGEQEVREGTVQVTDLAGGAHAAVTVDALLARLLDAYRSREQFLDWSAA
jgi:histidyl-tRNA synthetase